MTKDERFKIDQVLEMINHKLENDANSCELEFYIKLKKELEELCQKQTTLKKT